MDRLKDKHTYILERGIVVDELGEIIIPTVVEARGWAGYVCRPCNSNINLTCEFYANMVDTQFAKHSVVMVRRVPVSVEKINEYYDLRIECMETEWPNRYDLGCALRKEGAARWIGCKLQRGDLHLDSAFWNFLFRLQLS